MRSYSRFLMRPYAVIQQVPHAVMQSSTMPLNKKEFQCIQCDIQCIQCDIQ